MTTVFRSEGNAIAQVNNYDYAGFQGPTDWTTYADFSNEVYIKSGAATALSSVITSPDQGAIISLADKSGNTFISPAGVPRRSFIPAHGVFGIMSEAPNRGYMSGRNVIIGDNTSVVYALYATKGSVSIDPTMANILGGTGTSKDPLIFKYSNSGVIPTIMSRSDAMPVCIACPDNRVPLSIINEINRINDSDIIVNLDGIARDKFTVVLRVASPKLGAGILPAASGYVPIIRFNENEGRAISYIKHRNNSLNIQSRDGGKVKGTANEAAPVTETIDTYAISIDKGVINHYMNGAKIRVPGNLPIPGFTLNELRLLSSDTAWGTAKNVGALVNMVIYSRALGAAELATCLFK